MSNQPLYKDHNAPDKIPENSHKGLWYERFFNSYDRNWNVEEKKIDHIKSVEGLCGDAEKLKFSVLQQLKLGRFLNGDAKCYKTDWHFVTGMGNPHPVENGFAWHPTLGVPYLPGAAVKGLLRAWFKVWKEKEQYDEKHLLWFGHEQASNSDEQAGGFIFFDALPVSPPELIADIMTPHMGKWYSDGDEIKKTAGSDELEPEKLPADWHKPVPVPFLVVKQASFLFNIGIRNISDKSIHAQLKNDLSDVFEGLTEALSWIGAGAKTSAGYGCMSFDSAETSRLVSIPDGIERERQRERMQEARNIELENMSPFERSIALAEEKSITDNIAVELLLLKDLNDGKHQWAESEVISVANIIKDKMKISGKWKEKSCKKNPKKDKDYQRTLEVMRYLKEID